MSADEFEVREVFCSLEEWWEWHKGRPELFDNVFINSIAETVLRKGFVEPISGISVAPSNIEVGANYREGLIFKGVNSRMRATLVELGNIQSRLGLAESNLRLYVTEAITEYAMRLRARYRFFAGSEFLPTDEARREFFPVSHEDLMRLSFPERSFDVAICNEVFEHIPSIDVALKEMWRILKPGGHLVGTFPFCVGSHDSLVKARMTKEGVVEHLTAPEYHGNPVLPGGGSLVFEIPGWNIIDRAIAAGFQTAAMVFNASAKNGILANELTGIMTFTAKR